MMRRFVARATLCMGLGGMALAGSAAAGLHAGDVAPNFRGTDLNGVSRTLSEFRGKVVVLFVLGNT